MKPIRIFISSVQTEFAQERTALRDYLRNDPLIRRFFDVFLSRSELSKELGHKKASGQLYNIVRDLLDDQMIAYTLPDKPRSPRQKYQLTDKGRTELENLKSGNAV